MRHKVWIASGVAAVILGVAVWNTAGGHEAPVAASAGTARNGTPPAKAEPQVIVQNVPEAMKAVSQPVSRASILSSGAQAGWHVIAYTYRYEKQAEAKAMQLKERYTSLQPQVYSPTGRAPFFVALGGPSDSVSAIALRNRARRVGLPRDTYARNF
ncbi:MAG: hypothetical protein INR71_06155 [Terriglobus roseus]|nr:hypothetical protein [Terriglobus roseus]